MLKKTAPKTHKESQDEIAEACVSDPLGRTQDLFLISISGPVAL